MNAMGGVRVTVFCLFFLCVHLPYPSSFPGGQWHQTAESWGMLRLNTSFTQRQKDWLFSLQTGHNAHDSQELLEIQKKKKVGLKGNS